MALAPTVSPYRRIVVLPFGATCHNQRGRPNLDPQDMCCHILRWVKSKSGGMDINWSMGTTVVLGNPLSKTLSLYIDTPFFLDSFWE